MLIGGNASSRSSASLYARQILEISPSIALSCAQHSQKSVGTDVGIGKTDYGWYSPYFWFV